MIDRVVPAVALAGAALLLLVQAFPAASPPDEMKVEEFGKIPVVFKGRVKPADTFARNMLRIISEKETFVDAEGKKQPAIRWMLDVLVDMSDGAGRARKHKVFRIVNDQLLQALGLSPRPGYRYSIDEFGHQLPKLEEQVRKANEKKRAEQKLDVYETHLVKLEQSLSFYESMARFAIPHFVPPAAEGGEWQTLRDAYRAGQETGKPDPRAVAIVQMVQSYAAGDVGKFNGEAAGYVARFGPERPKDFAKASFEVFFNHFDPFNQCKHLYLLAFVLSCLGWLFWRKALSRAATGMAWLIFAVHTVALVSRIYLSGRPPVTNLYSSAIFIGWGCVLGALVLERAFKLGVETAVASIAGWGTLQIAYVLSADGDTMEVLQAVLDTQFWLATHVTCITLGYATTYLAGLIGVIYIIRGLLTPTVTPEVRTRLARMTYGIICFATFFSFVGTVLGGLWADDSWGRFWGWDPKENGALMIVLWNALTLHARWGGLVRERGLAVLAVFGNIVVSWSWFGVNELGVGLHSYGFTEGRKFWLILFCLSQVAVMVGGLMPRHLWTSPDAVRSSPAEESSANG